MAGSELSPKCLLMKEDSALMSAWNPSAANALRQGTPCCTSRIVRKRALNKATVSTLPSGAAAAASWYALFKCRLYLAKRCVSHGCNSQVIRAGMMIKWRPVLAQYSAMSR